MPRALVSTEYLLLGRTGSQLSAPEHARAIDVLMRGHRLGQLQTRRPQTGDKPALTLRLQPPLVLLLHAKGQQTPPEQPRQGKAPCATSCQLPSTQPGRAQN